MVGLSTVSRRTCVACRQQTSPDQMIRLVREEITGKAVIDSGRSMSGRGAWVHRDEGCVRAGLNPARLSGALRRSVQIDSGTLVEALGLTPDNAGTVTTAVPGCATAQLQTK